MTQYTGSIALSGSFIDYTWPAHIFDIDCNGDEDSLTECPHSTSRSSILVCLDHQDSSVVCQGIPKPNLTLYV